MECTCSGLKAQIDATLENDEEADHLIDQLYSAPNDGSKPTCVRCGLHHLRDIAGSAEFSDRDYTLFMRCVDAALV